MKIYRTNSVFVPGGLPDVTYIPRSERYLEDRLKRAQDNLCKLITLTGPTKCGKTVLTSRVYPRDEVLWLDGGSYTDETSFWSDINEQLDVFPITQKSTISRSQSEISGNIKGEGSIVVLKAKGDVGARQSWERGNDISRSRESNPKTTAIASLREKKVPIIIDDFHYLPRDVQAAVIRGLKALIFEGLPAIILAIPHRRYDAVRVEREMTGRIENVQVPTWELSELNEIAQVGFPLLNINVPKKIKDRFSSEALGSPHLMQEFCREFCRELRVDETKIPSKDITKDMLQDKLFKKVAFGTGRMMFDKLKRGPRQRSDRKARALKDGTATDIYGIVLHGLASARPSIQTMTYEEIRSAIRDISRDIPQAHEVSRVLEHMAKISADDEASTPVIDWDKEERLLHITDPFFAYYLRWGETDTTNR
jgi:hypothetical protein